MYKKFDIGLFPISYIILSYIIDFIYSRYDFLTVYASPTKCGERNMHLLERPTKIAS